MGLKALRTVLEEADEADQERLLANYKSSTLYNRNVGNIYTGSLYLSLISLLEQGDQLKDGSRIGLYSYGSGAVGEFFTGILQPNYREYLQVEKHANLFAARTEISIEEYEAVFQETVPVDGSTAEFDATKDTAAIYLAGIKDNMRQYVTKKN